MKTVVLAAIAIMALSWGAASASPLSDNPPSSTTICLSTGGQQEAAVCKVSGGRLDGREDICQCTGPTRSVVAPVCGPGVVPPGESAAYEQARAKAVSHGSLIGATWQGQPMCVAPRNRGGR